MPGLVDGHAHGSGFVACDMGYTGGTIEEVLGKLKACLLRDDQVGLLNSNLAADRQQHLHPVAAPARNAAHPRRAGPAERRAGR